jgi:hypothetical protein
MTGNERKYRRAFLFCLEFFERNENTKENITKQLSEE